MNIYRLMHTIGLLFCHTGQSRAKYLKKHKVLYSIGNNCMTMSRSIPLYPKLISLGNNVWIASNVNFATHDVIHKMLNNKFGCNEFQEHMGPILIQDNVFIGAGTRILSNVVIGANTVIAAGSLVNKSIPGNGVYGGVPAKYIGSLEDLIERRRQESNNQYIQTKKGNLSDENIEECWDRFKKLQGDLKK